MPKYGFNCKVCGFCKVCKAIFSTVYNIMQPKFSDFVLYSFFFGMNTRLVQEPKRTGEVDAIACHQPLCGNVLLHVRHYERLGTRQKRRLHCIIAEREVDYVTGLHNELSKTCICNAYKSSSHNVMDNEPNSRSQ